MNPSEISCKSVNWIQVVQGSCEKPGPIKTTNFLTS